MEALSNWFSRRQFMIAQFAGQGYIVIGADYFGMGDSTEPEGYMVKGSHQQATVDMLLAGQKVIRELGFQTGDLFLAGWSQGGFVTMALLEKLEEFGIPVAAAATASAPIDLSAAMKGMLFFSARDRRSLDWHNLHPVVLRLRTLL